MQSNPTTLESPFQIMEQRASLEPFASECANLDMAVQSGWARRQGSTRCLTYGLRAVVVNAVLPQGTRGAGPA